MSCDGHIDSREIELLTKLGEDQKLFGDLKLNEELNHLIKKINTAGETFLRDYLTELKEAGLYEAEELEIIRVAIKTIEADEKIEYSEIKFFKIIRYKLKISNNKILSVMPEIEEYLEQDIINDRYTDRLKADFFNSYSAPIFDIAAFPVIDMANSDEA